MDKNLTNKHVRTLSKTDTKKQQQTIEAPDTRTPNQTKKKSNNIKKHTHSHTPRTNQTSKRASSFIYFVFMLIFCFSGSVLCKSNVFD